jgi:uncharacterized membrane protein
MPNKQMFSSQTQPLRDLTNIKFEIFIVAFTILPFFILAYFYSLLPDRVPQFLTVTGEVATWVEKSVISVFRVPLMAVLTQIVCLLMRYGTLQSGALASLAVASEQSKLREQYLRLNAGLWDWFRWTVAFKMSAESLSAVFLSLERFKFLARPTFVITAMASLTGVAGALFYLYRLLAVKRDMKARFGDEYVPKSVDTRRVYGRVLYFNPSDPALFVSKYIFNLANKWAWIFITCIITYPLLVFFPE